MNDSASAKTGGRGSWSAPELGAAHLNEKLVPADVRTLLDDSGASWRLAQHPPLDTIGQGLALGIADILGLSADNLSKFLLLEDAGGC